MPELPERTLSQLVSDAAHDARQLVRSEIALAKSELRSDVTAAATGAALFALAAIAGSGAALMGLFAAAYGLVAAGLAPWLAFTIVAIVLLVVAGIAALVGKSRVGRAGPPTAALASARSSLASLQTARNPS
jgi:hypothetical protein